MGQTIQGTVIAAKITTGNTSSVYPVADQEEIKGGLHSVSKLDERNNIPLERREEGMLCYVIETSKTYKLYLGLNNQNWLEQPEYEAATDASIVISDIITNNVSIDKHGFTPKLPNDATKYLDGTGSYSVPPDTLPTDANITISDVTTNNVSISKHGFAPKAPNDATQFLNGAGNWSIPIGTIPTDLGLILSDITTNNVSITKHGFAPKLPNDNTKYLDGTGNWSSPPDIAATDSNLTLSDITTNNVSIDKHGFTPKLPNDATKYLDGTGNYSVPPDTNTLPTDSNITLSDITTNNVSIDKHGFAPKLPNDSTKYLNGAGSYSVPPDTLPTDANITLSDITTNNTSTTKHGFFPKLPSATGKYLKDDLTWEYPGTTAIVSPTKLATDLGSVYPDGYSIMRLDSGSGWPYSNGIIITNKYSSGYATQEIFELLNTGTGRLSRRNYNVINPLASDDFSGSTISSYRWFTNIEGGDALVYKETGRVTIKTTSNYYAYIAGNFDLAGDFDVTFEIDPADGSQQLYVGFMPSTVARASAGDIPGNHAGFYLDCLNGWVRCNNAAGQTIFNLGGYNLNVNKTYRLVRQNTTLTAYIDGVQTGTPNTVAGNAGTWYPIVHATGITWYHYFNSFTLANELSATWSTQISDWTSWIEDDVTPTDTNITLSDVTTNNASISKHGFLPKLPNDATKYLDGTGNYSVPAGGTGTGNGGSSSLEITQVNDFVPGNVVRFNGSSYVKAIASSVDSVGFLMVKSADTTKFTAMQDGYIDTLSNLSAGEYYFLSSDTAGEITTVEPTISNPVLYATSATSGWVLPYRPSIAATNAITSITISQYDPSPDEGIVGDLFLKYDPTLDSLVSKGLRVIHDVDLNSANDYTISNLNGNADGSYFIIVDGILSATTSDKYPKIRLNGDSNTSNYLLAMLHDTFFGGTTVSHEAISAANTPSGIIIGRTGWNNVCTTHYITCKTWVHTKSGKARICSSDFIHMRGDGTAGMLKGEVTGAWNNLSDNITSIVFNFDGATNFQGNIKLYTNR